MGFFSDFFDNVLGIDPPGTHTYYDAYAADKIAAEKAAADKAAADKAAANQGITDKAAADKIAADKIAADKIAADNIAAANKKPAFDPSPFRSQVDQGFSQFTPEFYANKFAEYYNPYKSGVDTQYGAAKDALTAGIAKRGLSDSQQGRSLFQQLDALRDQSLTKGQSGAQGFQSSLSDQVGSAKNALYGSIGEGADNASIGTRAQTEAGRLAGTAAASPSLGDIFGPLVTPYGSSSISNPGGPVNPEKQAFGNTAGGNLNLANVGGPSTQVVGTKKKKF